MQKHSSLDIYQELIHTEIKDERDAWLLFLSSTGVEDILEVCELFPEFIRMYENMFELQRDAGRLMAMFSEALKIMDKNTEIYMVEMAVKERDEERNKRKEIQNKLSNTQNKLNNTQDKLNNTQNELNSTQNELNDTRNELNQRDKRIEELLKQLEELRK